MPYATRMASAQTPCLEPTWKSTWTMPSTADVVWHLRMSSANLLCASLHRTVQEHSIGSFVASSRQPFVSVPKEYSWHWLISLCVSEPLQRPPLGQQEASHSRPKPLSWCKKALTANATRRLHPTRECLPLPSLPAAPTITIKLAEAIGGRPAPARLRGASSELDTPAALRLVAAA